MSGGWAYWVAFAEVAAVLLLGVPLLARLERHVLDEERRMWRAMGGGRL